MLNFVFKTRNCLLKLINFAGPPTARPARLRISAWQKFPLVLAGEFDGAGAITLPSRMALVAAAESYPDHAIRHKCGLMAYAWAHVFDLVPTFSWDDVQLGRVPWQRWIDAAGSSKSA